MSWLPEPSTHSSSQHPESSKKQLMKKSSKGLPRINNTKLSNIGRNVVAGRNINAIMSMHTGSLIPRSSTLNTMIRSPNRNKETHSKLRSANNNSNNNTNNNTNNTSHKTSHKTSESINISSLSMPKRKNRSSISIRKRGNSVVEENRNSASQESKVLHQPRLSREEEFRLRASIPMSKQVTSAVKENRHSTSQESKKSHQPLLNRAKEFLARAKNSKL
jgi:hypothetical protein